MTARQQVSGLTLPPHLLPRVPSVPTAIHTQISHAKLFRAILDIHFKQTICDCSFFLLMLSLWEMLCWGESSEVVPTNPEPALRLVLVRHGESQNNALAEQLSGSSEFEARRHVDPDLTDLGRRQAESLATFLADGAARSQAVSQILPLAHVCVSPMKRALQTAAPLVSRLGVSAEIGTDCFEVGGMYHEGGTVSKGLSPKEMKREISCSVPDEVSEDGWCGLRERETREEAKLRANLVATRIRRMAQTDAAGLRGSGVHSQSGVCAVCERWALLLWKERASKSLSVWISLCLDVCAASACLV